MDQKTQLAISDVLLPDDALDELSGYTENILIMSNVNLYGDSGQKSNNKRILYEAGGVADGDCETFRVYLREDLDEHGWVHEFGHSRGLDHVDLQSTDEEYVKNIMSYSLQREGWIAAVPLNTDGCCSQTSAQSFHW